MGNLSGPIDTPAFRLFVSMGPSARAPTAPTSPAAFIIFPASIRVATESGRVVERISVSKLTSPGVRVAGLDVGVGALPWKLNKPNLLTLSATTAPIRG